jgi:hypothetical protein
MEEIKKQIENIKIYDYLLLLCHLIVAVLCIIILKNQHPDILLYILLFIFLYLVYEDENNAYKIISIGATIYLLKTIISFKSFKYIINNLWEIPFWCIVGHYLIIL